MIFLYKNTLLQLSHDSFSLAHIHNFTSSTIGKFVPTEKAYYINDSAGLITIQAYYIPVIAIGHFALIAIYGNRIPDSKNLK